MEECDRQAGGKGESKFNQGLEWALIRIHIYTLLQMNSVSTGSDSPMYSVIFLLIHGPTLFSINV